MTKKQIQSMSPGLKEYVRSKGGVISIGNFYQIQG